MSKISASRKALVLKRCDKAEKIITMIARVKGLNVDNAKDGIQSIRDQIEEYELKGGKGKKAAPTKGKSSKKSSGGDSDLL